MAFGFVGRSSDEVGNERSFDKNDIVEGPGYFTDNSMKENQSSTMGVVERIADDLSSRVQFKG